MLKTGKSRFLSLLLAVVLVMSCLPTFAASVTAEETSSSTQIVYYVKGGATGNGSSEDNPAGTISALIEQITDDGYNFAGQEVVVKVIDNGSNYFHYNYDGGAVIPSHAATLSFESYDSENISFLSVSPRKVGSSTLSRTDAQHLKLGGPAKFKNLKLLFGRTNGDWLEMYCGGYDATFENVSIYGFSNDTYTIPALTTGATGEANNTAIGFGAYNNSSDNEGGTLTIDAATIDNNGLGIISSSAYASGYNDQLTLENDVKVVLGAGTIKSELRIGGSPSGNSIAYKKNLNLVLNGTQVPLLYSRNYIAAMTDGHALQIIYNGGATIASETTGTYAFTHLTRYDIHVENVEGAALDTTETAGTYKVTFPEGKTVARAIGSNGTVYLSNGNTITVGAAGVYNVDFLSEIPAPTYYLKGGETEGDGSAESPFGTTTELVNAIKSEGFNHKDITVTVKVVKSDSDTGFGEANALYVNPYGYTTSSDAWGNAVTAGDVSSVLSHNATIVYESADTEARSELWAANATTIRYTVLRIGGPTVFRNIDLRINRSNGEIFCLFSTGYDVELENVKFRTNDGAECASGKIELYQGGFHNNNGATMGKGGTLIIDEATLARTGYVSAMGWTSQNQDYIVGAGYQSYTEEAKVVLNGGALGTLTLRNFSGNATASFGDNVNIILNGTALTTFKTNSNSISIADGKALQVIYNGGASIATNSNINLTRYDIYVENIEGAALDTTETAGTYKVTFPEGMKYAIAEDEQGTQYVSEGNLLTVGEAGVYNITFAKKIKGDPYYVKGGATGDGSSEDNPAGTISALIAKITEDGYNVAGEEVVVKVIDNGSTYFHFNYENGNYVIPSHKATLAFESYDEEASSFLSITPRVGSSDTDSQYLKLGGPAKFKNLKLLIAKTNGNWLEMYCGGYDATFENVLIYGYSNTAYTTPALTSGATGGANNTAIGFGAYNNSGDGEGGTLTIDAATINNNGLGIISSSAYINTKSYTDQFTFDNDVKVVLGAGTIKTALRIGGSPSGDSIAYKKNLNLVLNGTQVPLLYSRNYIAAMTEGHALQIIYNGGATIASETTGTYAFTHLTRYDIFVENLTGASLDTTETAGTYAVTYPADKSIVYFYAVDSNGDYDGTTPITYANTATISVGNAGKYKVGFASDPSEINVDIVNENVQFEGFANSTEDGLNGTLTPVAAASNIVETDVSSVDGAIVYTADINFEANSRTIISAMGDVGESVLVELSDVALKLGGYTASGEFGYGKYRVKVTLVPASSAVFIEITTPDGDVIRRGGSSILAGNTAYSMIVSKTSFEDGVSDISAANSGFVPENYTINETEPTYTGFEADVYNLVTSYDVDAKTTRTFAWTANVSFVSADETMQVRYNEKGSDEYKLVDAVRKTEKTVYDDIDFFEADITGLTPGTTYEYCIGKKDSSDDWSKVYSFTTEAENDSSFSFITIADTQGDDWTGRGFMYAQTALAEALNDVENPAFIINAGDLVEKGGRETMWVQYFKAMGDTIKSVPHFAVMGNHEYQESGGPDTDFLFNLHFNHPNNGGENAIKKWSNLGNSVMNAINNPKESAYSYDYGNAHFVVLNSGPSGGTDAWLLGAQKEWLQSDLEASDAQWKIVVVHQPAHIASGANEYFTKYDIDKTMEELGVDLVIQGHAHYNTRTYPMKDRTAVRKDNPDLIEKGEGTVYSIVGSTTTNHDVLVDDLNENYVSVFSPKAEMPVYATVDVTNSSLTYTVKQVDGFIVDQFTIYDEEAYYAPESIGAQIRVPSSDNAVVQALRFVGSISLDIYEEFEEEGLLPENYDDNGAGFGMVVLPTDLIPEGETLTKKTAKSKIVPAVKIYSKDSEKVTFTACLTGITEDKYEVDYMVVPYVTLSDGTTYYGEAFDASVYEIAQLCYADTKTSASVKQYMLESILNIINPEEYPLG